MLQEIENCFKCQQIVSCYFNKDDNCVHLTGYICGFNENELLIAHITPRGEYDGFVLNNINGLYRIENNGDYENKINLLYKIKKQKHPVLNCSKNDLVSSLLSFSCEEKLLVTLELNNDSITGYVDKYDNYVKLRVVDEYGKNNGTCIIDIDEIVTFACDTDYEQDIRLLSCSKEIAKLEFDEQIL